MAILDQYGKPMSAMDASPVASARGAATPRRARLTNRTTGLPISRGFSILRSPAE